MSEEHKLSSLWERVEIGAILLEGNLVMSNKYTMQLLIELAITYAQKNLPLDQLVKVHQSNVHHSVFEIAKEEQHYKNNLKTQQKRNG